MIMRTHASRMRAAAALIGWLVSRPLYGIELSRLAVFRLRPRVRIQWVRRSPTRWRICQWVFTQGRAYCLTLADERERRLVVRQFERLCGN
ncbi:MAG: hypothetical protein ACUVTG_13750 [Candidatus Oleimicrobiaceae bacterium]